MSCRIILLLSLVSCLPTILVPDDAFGEKSGNLYLGVFSNRADDMTVTLGEAPVRSYADSDSGSIIGGRLELWLDRYPWLGVAGDVSVSEVDYSGIVHSIVPVSVLAMGRLSLYRGRDFPNGRVHPYIGVGLGYYWGGISELIEEVPPAGGVLDDTYFKPGLDARFGIELVIEERYGILLEYGFKNLSPEFDSQTSRGMISLNPTLSSHSFSAGISLKF